MEEPDSVGKSNAKSYLLVTIFLLVLAVGGGIYVVSSNKVQPQNSTLPASAISTPTGQTNPPSATVLPTTASIPQETTSALTMDNGLKIEDEVVGNGVEAVSGKKVTVNYVGNLTDGTKFDSSYDHGTPFSFNLGAGEVIPGWDQGVAGMKVGGKRKLTIPPSLGYGAQGAGPIPANSTLIFEVELLGVE